MIWDWYRLFNRADFLATGLPSYEVQVELVGIGIRNILITQGIATSITVDDTMLTIDLNDRNPFRYGSRAVFIDENDDVWLGVERAD